MNQRLQRGLWAAVVSACVLTACDKTLLETDPHLDTVVITGASGLMVRETAQLEAAGKDQHGADFQVSTFTWTSSDETKATVSGDGLITAHGTGAVTITAEADGKSGSHVVTVAGVLNHNRTIAADETWAAADNPHVIRGTVHVRGTATPVLTVEAGAIVRFETEGELWIGSSSGGVLTVAGTAASPVTFTASTSSPVAGHWQAIHLADGAGGSSIAHATIEYCGASGFYGKVCVSMVGPGSSGNLAVPVNDVLVRHGGGVGFHVDHGGRFGPGSANVTVETMAEHPMVIQAAHAGTLPAGGTFTGNTLNTIHLREGILTATQTWPNLGIPYMVDGRVRVQGTETPILTLPAGTELRFTSESSLWTGSGGGGGLQVQGTAEAPVLFTAHAASPAAGHWEGITFDTETSGTLVNHAIIEYGGESSFYGSGNAILARDLGAILTNTLIRHSSGCGVVRVTHSAGWATDFTAVALANTFASNATADQCGPS